MESLFPEKFKIVAVKPKFLKNVKKYSKACKYGITTLERKFAEKIVEHGNVFLLTFKKICLGHGQLVLVGI